MIITYACIPANRGSEWIGGYFFCKLDSDRFKVQLSWLVQFVYSRVVPKQYLVAGIL